MMQSMVELAKELTLALVQTGQIPPEAIQDTLQQTHATLTALKGQEEAGTPAPVSASDTAVVEWRKSIRKHTVACLECGQAFKQLSRRHLRMHGLDLRSYRSKYGIPLSQPLSARSTTERRRSVVRDIRPWEKTPAYLKKHEQNGTASPEPEIEAVREEAQELSAVTSAPQKRQRKTATKKKAARKMSAVA